MMSDDLYPITTELTLRMMTWPALMILFSFFQMRVLVPMFSTEQCNVASFPISA
jgi:hypothetical protein